MDKNLTFNSLISFITFKHCSQHFQPLSLNIDLKLETEWGLVLVYKCIIFQFVTVKSYDFKKSDTSSEADSHFF